MSSHPPSQLTQVVKKLDWAYEHIKNLDACINEFSNSHPYTLVLKNEGEVFGKEYEVTSFEQPPIDFSLRIGDAVHNLRSSLNYLACALVRIRKPRSACGSLFFPITSDPDEFYSSLCKAHMDLAGEAVVKFIERHQPYQTGYEPLGILSNLNNIDKHRFLVLTVSAVQTIGAKVSKAGEQETSPEVGYVMFESLDSPCPWKKAQ